LAWITAYPGVPATDRFRVVHFWCGRCTGRAGRGLRRSRSWHCWARGASCHE
jgi:hypothetical protein